MNDGQHNVSLSHLLYSRVKSKMGGDIAEIHNLTMHDQGTIVDIAGDELVVLFDRRLPKLDQWNNKIYVRYGKHGQNFYDNFEDAGLALTLMDFTLYKKNDDFICNMDWLFPWMIGVLPVSFHIRIADSAPYRGSGNAYIFHYPIWEWKKIIHIPSMMIKSVAPDDDEPILDHFEPDIENLLRQASYILLSNDRD